MLSSGGEGSFKLLKTFGYDMCKLLAVNGKQVILEAEIDNSAALRLYENLGFIRDKRLHKYYLNGHDAFRLHLLLN